MGDADNAVIGGVVYRLGMGTRALFGRWFFLGGVGRSVVDCDEVVQRVNISIVLVFVLIGHV